MSFFFKRKKLIRANIRLGTSERKEGAKKSFRNISGDDKIRKKNYDL